MVLILSDFIKEYPHFKAKIKEIVPEKIYDFNIENGAESPGVSLGARIFNDPNYSEKRDCWIEFKTDLSDPSSINKVNLSKNSDSGSILITITTKLDR